VIQAARLVLGQFAVVLRVGKRGQPSRSGARAAYFAYCSVSGRPPTARGLPPLPGRGMTAN